MADVKKATPALECYSRAVHHLGPLGCGEIGKTVNNMLHWVHSLANEEVLLLAKVVHKLSRNTSNCLITWHFAKMEFHLLRVNIQ